MSEITCLQVGEMNWATQYHIPSHVEWIYMDNKLATQTIAHQLEHSSEEEILKKYDVMLLTDVNMLEEYDSLLDLMDFYTILYDSDQEVVPKLKNQLDRKMSFSVSLNNPEQIIDDIATYFYQGQYGLRILPENLLISNNYTGMFSREGAHEVIFDGDFGEDFCYLCSWRDHNRSLADMHKKTELFLEHQLEGNVEIQMSLSEINQYSGKIQKRFFFSQSDLKKALEYGPKLASTNIYNYQLYAKGRGKIHLGTLHLRFSRGRYGSFILGGQRQVDSLGHELITYFNPGDYQPPLCVYFGGFRSAEGFEGYYMMKNLKVPFLLVEDLGLVGGAFYRGTVAYRQLLVQKIKDTLQYLGFSNNQLVLSGMSMGTHASLYYVSDLQPHSVIINKPLVNLNEVARNQILKAPQVYPFIFDIETYLAKHIGIKSVNDLDEEFWQHFKDGKFDSTQFYIAHMLNDDYDDIIFNQLRDRFIQSKKVITHKAIPGRHNDNGSTSVGAFLYYYYLVLSKNFQRE